jgi:SAM-dependent methyltransferase
MSFDRFYNKEECFWGLSPDPTLVENINEIPVGKTLDLGVGEGRNALYLAHKGFQVTGIDISTKAIEKFLNLAENRDLKVDGIAMNIKDFDFQPSTYTLIVSHATLHFLKRSEVYKIINDLKSSVSPGGYVYIEDFTVEDPGYQRAKKILEEVEENTFYSTKIGSYIFYFKTNELKNMFNNFEIKTYREGIFTDQGHGSQGPHKHGEVQLFGKKL